MLGDAAAGEESAARATNRATPCRASVDLRDRDVDAIGTNRRRGRRAGRGSSDDRWSRGGAFDTARRLC